MIHSVASVDIGGIVSHWWQILKKEKPAEQFVDFYNIAIMGTG